MSEGIPGARLKVPRHRVGHSSYRRDRLRPILIAFRIEHPTRAVNHHGERRSNVQPGNERDPRFGRSVGLRGDDQGRWAGRLAPLDRRDAEDWPSGDLFGLSQNAGMGWTATEVARDPYLILSTQGGLRALMAGRSRWAITRVTGRSASWSRRPPRN